MNPQNAADVAEIIRSHPGALEPIGCGSKRSIGRAVDADPLNLSALAGIVDYAPDELVMTLRASTPLEIIETTLAEQGQRLAFEPPDWGALLSVDRPQTIGGVIATNLSGSRRVSAGAARDHFLGFEAVSGRGELFKAGGKVVKNVTGYDLPKLLAGSWGTLAVLTDVTLRVAPAPETEITVLVPDEKPEQALLTLTAALGSADEVSAAAFDPWRGTALRLEGFTASVSARQTALLASLGVSDAEILDSEASREFWRQTGNAEALADWPVVWRISVPPSEAPRVLSALAPERYFLDWGGGLIWAAVRCR